VKNILNCCFSSFPSGAVAGNGLDPETKDSIDSVFRASKLQKSTAMGSVSRLDVYHGVEEHEESYQYFDILKERTDPIDQAIKIPAPEDELFSNTEVPERSRVDKKRKIVTRKELKN
jgi:hypothetical protein